MSTMFFLFFFVQSAHTESKSTARYCGSKSGPSAFFVYISRHGIVFRRQSVSYMFPPWDPCRGQSSLYHRYYIVT